MPGMDIDPKLVLRTYLARAIAGEPLSDAAVTVIAKRLAVLDPDAGYEGNEMYFHEYAKALINELAVA